MKETARTKEVFILTSSKDEKSIFNNQEEIAEEFGVFQTVSERDFLTFHLLKKARKEKEKAENKRKKKAKSEGDDKV